MNSKDKVNKISGIASIITLIVIIFGQIVGNESLLGYSQMPFFFIP